MKILFEDDAYVQICRKDLNNTKQLHHENITKQL